MIELNYIFTIYKYTREIKIIQKQEVYLCRFKYNERRVYDENGIENGNFRLTIRRQKYTNITMTIKTIKYLTKKYYSPQTKKKKRIIAKTPAHREKERERNLQMKIFSLNNRVRVCALQEKRNNDKLVSEG